MLRDALGSTIGFVNSGGSIATSYGYEPFGKTSRSGSSTTNPYAFAGRELDASGLYFMRARYYNPLLSRFISQDPLGLGGGQVNFFAYVGNSPMNFVDPTGEVWGGSPGPPPTPPDPPPPAPKQKQKPKPTPTPKPKPKYILGFGGVFFTLLGKLAIYIFGDPRIHLPPVMNLPSYSNLDFVPNTTTQASFYSGCSTLGSAARAILNAASLERPDAPMMQAPNGLSLSGACM